MSNRPTLGSHVNTLRKMLTTEHNIRLVFGDCGKFEFHGNNGKCVCPFHDDTDPSLSISITNDKLVWHCFGCGASGDVFNFVARRMGKNCKTNFKEVVLEVSRLIGLHGYEDVVFSSSKHKGFAAAHGNLSNANKHYLKSRCVKDLSIFGEEHGVIKISYQTPDTFYSISHNPQGSPKYKNDAGMSKDYPFYLYKHTNADTLYIVEGVFDAINLTDLGFPAVALMGNKMSRGVLGNLQRTNVENIVMCLDNDEPGKHGTIKAIFDLYNTRKFNVFYINYPFDFMDYKDINDFLQEGVKNNTVDVYKDELKQMLKNNTLHGYKQIIESFHIKYTTMSGDLEKSNLITKLFSSISKFKPNIKQDIVDYYQDVYGVDLHKLHLRYHNNRVFHDMKDELSEVIADNDDVESAFDNVYNTVLNAYKKRMVPVRAMTFKDLPNRPDTKQYDSKMVPNLKYYQGAISFIAARTSHGKTTFMMNESVKLSAENSVCFMTLEESNYAILDKMFVCKYNLANPDKMITLRNFDSKNPRWKPLLDKWSDNLFVMEPKPYIEDIVDAIYNHHAVHKTEIFFVDYIQLITSKDDAFDTKQPYKQIKHINSMLLETAKDLNITIISGAQMNRDVKSVDDIHRSNIYREAGDIEQDANLIINLFKERQGDGSDLMHYYVAKNRNGRLGLKGNGDFLGANYIIYLTEENK